MNAENGPFPAFRMNGTPSHRGLLTYSVVAANVGQFEFFGTVSSSRYPGLPFALAYWPRSVFSRVTGAIALRTLTCQVVVSKHVEAIVRPGRRYVPFRHGHPLRRTRLAVPLQRRSAPAEDLICDMSERIDDS